MITETKATKRQTMYVYPYLFFLPLNINLSHLSVPVAPSMPRKWTVWTAVTPTLVSGETTWFCAAALPHPPCVPHPPTLAPSAAPRLRRWRPPQTVATVMSQRSRVWNRCHFVQSDLKSLKTVQCLFIPLYLFRNTWVKMVKAQE